MIILALTHDNDIIVVALNSVSNLCVIINLVHMDSYSVPTYVFTKCSYASTNIRESISCSCYDFVSFNKWF